MRLEKVLDVTHATHLVTEAMNDATEIDRAEIGLKLESAAVDAIGFSQPLMVIIPDDDTEDVPADTMILRTVEIPTVAHGRSSAPIGQRQHGLTHEVRTLLNVAEDQLRFCRLVHRRTVLAATREQDSDQQQHDVTKHCHLL